MIVSTDILINKRHKVKQKLRRYVRAPPSSTLDKLLTARYNPDKLGTFFHPKQGHPLCRIQAPLDA